MSTENKRKIPKFMPETPQELLAFVAYPEYYEGETETEYNERKSLCEKLAGQYAEYTETIKLVDKHITELTKPNIWLPNRKGK